MKLGTTQILLTFFALFFAENSWCQDSTQTLPIGINTTMIRMAHISGLSQSFTQDGSVYQFGDLHTYELNSTKLAQIEPKVKELVSALNKFGNYSLGTQINVGTVRIDAFPKVDYMAPVYARGITNNWTVGFALPVITYNNSVVISDYGSNINYYKTQFSGISNDLDSALNQMGQNMSTVIAQRLVENGYKPLDHKDEHFLGDVQLVSLLKISENNSSSALLKMALGLPTGPQYDPDDLSALNIFGRKSVDTQILYNQKFFSSFTATLKAGLKYTLADHAIYRVPTNENDVLPSAQTKENISRQIGAEYLVGAGLNYSLNSKIDFGISVDERDKDSDTFSGDRNTRYDLLSQNTNTKRLEAKLSASYSSVNTYLEKKTGIPMSAQILLGETLSGINTDKRETQEFVLSMYF